MPLPRFQTVPRAKPGRRCAGPAPTGPSAAKAVRSRASPPAPTTTGSSGCISSRGWHRGRAPAFQAGDRGSIPLPRSIFKQLAGSSGADNGCPTRPASRAGPRRGGGEGPVAEVAQRSERPFRGGRRFESSSRQRRGVRRRPQASGRPIRCGPLAQGESGCFASSGSSVRIRRGPPSIAGDRRPGAAHPACRRAGAGGAIQDPDQVRAKPRRARAGRRWRHRPRQRPSRPSRGGHHAGPGRSGAGRSPYKTARRGPEASGPGDT